MCNHTCIVDACALQIFFDDNIGHTAAHIVDARDVRSGEPLAFKVCLCAGLHGPCSYLLCLCRCPSSTGICPLDSTAILHDLAGRICYTLHSMLQGSFLGFRVLRV